MLTLEGGDVHLLDIRTRLPFKYGIATMTECPQAFVRVFLTVDGQPHHGTAADGLPPKWFTKDPSKPLHTEIEEMLRVIERALDFARDLRGETPFDAWRQLYEAQDTWGRRERLAPLLVHLGTSLVERALLDGFCRSLGQPFWQALHDNHFGINLGSIHPVLSGRRPADLLPGQPLRNIIARHTIGLADPLTEAEITPAERVDDGLPQSLEACVRTYGLRHLKIKICGQLDRDQDRLVRIAALLGELAPPDFAVSLDGNEQFQTPGAFREYWHALRVAAELRPLFEHLLFVEQPLHRDVALDPVKADFRRSWPDRPPIIIDESDGELTSLPLALELGYAGTSHKNCKGIFKGIANACLLAHLRQEKTEARFVLSGEDLANIGPIALLQDLTVDSALGIGSVERNGHHYYAGLSMYPPRVQQQILQAHADLYHRSAAGWPTLDIRDGTIRLDSLLAAPFGFAPVLDVEQFPSLAEWRRRHLHETLT